MDNKKIGKLIKKLRKEKDLTQQELGDIVGVGSRSVSKWERGLTCPDISIIKHLSKVLDISSDELLSGEVNKNNKGNNNFKKKINKTSKMIIVFIILILLLIPTVMIIRNNMVYEYELVSVSNDYSVDGYVTLKGDKLRVKIDKIKCNNEKVANTRIVNYEYKIKIGEKYIANYGYNSDENYIIQESNISDVLETVTINLIEQTNLSYLKLSKQTITININYINFNKVIIEDSILLSLRKK